MPPERGICMCLQESNFKFIPIVSNHNNCLDGLIIIVAIYNPKLVPGSIDYLVD